MAPVAKLASTLGVCLFGGFFGIVFWKVLTGRIRLAGLFDGDIRNPNSVGGYSSYVSAGRVQALLTAVFVALYYLLRVIHDPREFPSLPGGLVVALAASQAVYLGGKAQAMLLGRLRDFLK